ncbi:MAG: hypothetical protein HOL74_04745, partial [Flavobacteriales bacterium]|nr:hypothetical protein [Flavobacteriales bacterium]
MKKILFIALTTLLFFACKHELERPTWDVDMVLPIAHTQLNINNIITDTLDIITEDEDGFISLVYQENLLNINYDSLLLLETKSEEKSIKIDSVDFDDVVIEHVITIGSVINELPLGTWAFPDGSQRDIPAMPGIIQNDTINIDAIEYFETMTLYNGMLNLDLTNGFPTDISNVSFALYNSTNQNIIATFSTPLIESGDTYSESVSVAGETLDHLMIGIINNMDVDASNGLVLINYTDAITTKISITEIKIMEATAYFPNQLLHSENVEESFELGSARLTEIGIKEGGVIINALSTLPDTGTIIYAIPSLSKNGITFETEVKVPPNTSGEPTQFIFNFDGYIMDLTGEDGRVGGDTVNTIYATLEAYLDSTGELETIHQVDSFYLFNEYFFTPEYAKGYIGKDTFAFGPEIIETDVFKFMQSGSIDLNSAKINIEIDNYIGADAAFQINNLSALNNETEVSAPLDNTELHTIGRASLSGNNTITPTHTEIEIEANEMLEIFPNKINTSATLYLNPNGPAATEGFLFPNFPIEANLGVTIPLSFIANELALSNSTEIEIENIQELEILYITIENGLPLEANIMLIALDETEQITDTLIINQHILAALTNSDGKVTENRTSTLEIKNIDFSDITKINAIA